MSTLSELKKSLLADGVIDAEEVKQLDALLYADGVIEKEEAEWLYNKVKGDGQVDALERKLPATIKEKAKSFPAKLAELL